MFHLHAPDFETNGFEKKVLHMNTYGTLNDRKLLHKPNEPIGYSPNVVIEWLTLLLHIWEVLGSNLSS
jgi:hypothetical protein